MPAQSPRTFDNQRNQRSTEKQTYEWYPRARMLWYKTFWRARRRYGGFLAVQNVRFTRQAGGSQFCFGAFRVN